jgi:uncharacterized protein YceK
MKTKTAEDFEKQVKEKNITSWILRYCSMCDAPLSFLFDGDDVYYDSGCDCVNFRTIPQESSYDELANHYNRNIKNEEYLKEINEYFGFKD